MKEIGFGKNYEYWIIFGVELLNADAARKQNIQKGYKRASLETMMSSLFVDGGRKKIFNLESEAPHGSGGKRAFGSQDP